MKSDPGAASQRSRALKTIVIGFAAALALAVVAGGGVWALTCPCEGTPGFVLRGDLTEDPVTDWSFANDVPLCQIQISMGWRPHSLNLNCMASPDGELFLSCSSAEQKYWCPRVQTDHQGRLRLDGTLYPVVLNRVTDPAILDKAWTARIRKLQKPEVQRVQPGGGGAPPPLDAARPDTWWTFHVRSAQAE